MFRITLFAIVSIMFNIAINAQNPPVFGELSNLDKSFTTFDEDPEASAVMLYEKGDVSFVVKGNRIYLVKNYHRKIKILSPKGFNYGKVSIPIVATKNLHEDIVEIAAITHNDDSKMYLQQEEIYFSNSLPGIIEVSFAFPNLKKGSILEYKYTILSPFFFKLDSWEFQGSIPKLYTEFTALIPLKYVYNRTLVGSLKLSKNQVKKISSCFVPPGGTAVLSCEQLVYVMKNVPAFTGGEEFMLGPSNYIARLDFELSKINGYNGGTKFSTTWEDIDSEFRDDKNLGEQLHYKGFFRRKVPDSLRTGNDELLKARNIYEFVRNHYTWNGKSSIYGEVRLKEAFSQKKGSLAEINMSLINILNSAGIKTNLMMISSRDRGLPKKAYPNISDFNYIIAKAKINGEDYLLDATSKYHPFGVLPLHTLNHYGRVMDLDGESYWHDIKPHSKNKQQIRAYLDFNLKSQTAQGTIYMLSEGYEAIALKQGKGEYDDLGYVGFTSRNIANDTEIESYEQIKERTTNLSIYERFEFKKDITLNEETIYLNIFLLRFFKNNPFLERDRRHPIDFGYPRHYKYQIIISIPEDYKVKELPKKDVVKLGDNMASMSYDYFHDANKVTLNFNFKVNHTYFKTKDYPVLRELFSSVTSIQRNSFLVLEKK